MASLINDFLKLVGDDIATIAEDGTISDSDAFIDTGSYTLNAILSGSIFGGHPVNKVSALAAEEAVGKTFVVLQLVKQFLDDNPKGLVVYNDTEGALDKKMLQERGIDTKRMLMLNPATLEQFKNKNHQIIQNYMARPEKERVPMLFAVDSLTQLPSAKELSDSDADKDSGDMGMRAKVIRAAFRVLRLSLSKAKIPFVVTNHVYKSTGMFPTTEMAGGGGLKYAADIIVVMGKKKDKDDSTKEVRGNTVYLQAVKSRLVKQYSQAQCYISYSKGLDRYRGLEEFALEAGVFKKEATRILVPSGKKVFMKELYANPTEYYTDEVLKAIDQWVVKKFGYGLSVEDETLEEITEE
jgi:RecA/RadA recombinase